MNSQERRRITSNFFWFMQGVEPNKIASMLESSEVQVRRWQNAENTPNETTCRTMQQLCDEARLEMLLTPSERLQRDERRRADAEEKQKLTSVVEIDGLEEKVIPKWYANTRELLSAERWEEALGRLEDRITDETDWSNIPEKTKAYVLADAGVCCHKLGRFPEAIGFARRAIDERLERAEGPLSNAEHDALCRFMAVVYSNIGCSHMQLADFEAAETYFEQSIENSHGYIAAFYNKLCCASLQREPDNVKVRLGELMSAASIHQDAAELEELADEAEADTDLVFARQLGNIFSETMAVIRNRARSKRNAAANRARGSESETEDTKGETNATR